MSLTTHPQKTKMKIKYHASVVEGFMEMKQRNTNHTGFPVMFVLFGLVSRVCQMILMFRKSTCAMNAYLDCDILRISCPLMRNITKNNSITANLSSIYT